MRVESVRRPSTFAMAFIALFLAFVATIVYDTAIARHSLYYLWSYWSWGYVPHCDRDLLGVSRRDCVQYHAVLGVLSQWLRLSVVSRRLFLGYCVTISRRISRRLFLGNNDDCSWGTPCWLVVFLMCVSTRCILCLTSSSSGSVVVSNFSMIIY